VPGETSESSCEETRPGLSGNPLNTDYWKVHLDNTTIVGRPFSLSP